MKCISTIMVFSFLWLPLFSGEPGATPSHDRSSGIIGLGSALVKYVVDSVHVYQEQGALGISYVLDIRTLARQLGKAQRRYDELELEAPDIAEKYKVSVRTAVSAQIPTIVRITAAEENCRQRRKIAVEGYTLLLGGPQQLMLPTRERWIC